MLPAEVSSPLAQAVIGLLPVGLDQLTIEESEPAPWKQGWTSLMWAAEHGLVAETADLLERGAPTTSPRRSEVPYRLAMRRGHVPVMEALRAAGAEHPVLPRPPGAEDAVVMRPYIGWVFWWLAPIAPVVGVIVAVVARSWVPAVVGCHRRRAGCRGRPLGPRTRWKDVGGRRWAPAVHAAILALARAGRPTQPGGDRTARVDPPAIADLAPTRQRRTWRAHRAPNHRRWIRPGDR